MQANSTHRDEREGASRVDRDARRVGELGFSGGAVEEALGAAAGERGGRPGSALAQSSQAAYPVLRDEQGSVWSRGLHGLAMYDNVYDNA